MVVAFFVCEIINLGSVDLMVIALPKEDQMSYPLYIESVDLMVVALHVYVHWVSRTKVGRPLKHTYKFLMQILYDN